MNDALTLTDAGDIQGKAYAKINLALSIKGKRADGYHEMDMLMAKVSLFDEIEVQRLDGSEESQLILSGSPEESLTGGDNLILKAHRAVEKAVGRRLPCRYFLNKKIPIAAGLGGGSSDAASAIEAVNKLYGLGLSRERLHEIAAAVGSDMPFFLFSGRGNVVRAMGRGIDLVETGAKLNAHVIIIKPCEGLSTGEVFALYKDFMGENPDIGGFLEAIRRPDFKAMKRCGGNSLFPAALSLRPKVAGAIDALYQKGALYAAMTGSGPSVFGLYDDKTACKAAFLALKERYGEMFACEII